jgi:cleavage and polyadenylation specificity factor subunit 4
VSTPNHNELTTNGVCKKFIHGKCRLSDNCPHPHDKSKIKPCNKFESMGTCGYGDKCNFSHDLKICPDFMREKCEKGEHCSFRHVYKSCPNFDMGFCFHGKTCKFKHIVRKLCWDYMYGFCEKGAKCPDYHPKIFVEEDFQGTKKLFEQLSKNDPQYYICNYCAQIGHKVSKCPKRVEIEPKDVFKCGLCGNVHSFADDCNYKA